jgi:hypothetical protein
VKIIGNKSNDFIGSGHNFIIIVRFKKTIKTFSLLIGSEVLTEVVMKISVFWEITDYTALRPR